MPAHLKLAFGVGNFFNFNFEYRAQEISPIKIDPKSVTTEFDIARVSSSLQQTPRVYPLMN